VHQAREVAEETTYGLSNAAANVVQRWEGSERERREQFVELILL
jgi:hypothetical protein